jgi:HAD superfamily phosphoserine phosphatase-like hydrolase
MPSAGLIDARSRRLLCWCSGLARSLERDHARVGTRLRLAVFDLDGTLTQPGSSVLAHLGDRLGFRDVAQQLIAGYANGTLSNADVSRIAAQELAGCELEQLTGALDSLPTVDGIAETVQYLSDGGVFCAISTITVDFAANDFAQRYGFSRVSATRLELSPRGMITGNVTVALDREGKRCFVQRMCAELRITRAQALFVGDARSDIPAMRMAGYSVAFNATSDVRSVASVAVDDSRDLRDVLAAVRHALGRAW